jgi:hypothetical protein
MLKTAVAATGLAVLLASPATAAQGGTGPFSGTVRQGQTKTHRYDNNPLNNPCPLVIVNYTVTLTYAPASDVLTLSVGSLSATGSNGFASLSFERSYCTSFDITVTGTTVQHVASYTVTVSRGGGAVA